MNNETASEIEVMVAFHFGIRENVIVPNVTSWLVWNRECDLIVLNKNGYASEVEIKVSKSDLLKDKKKWHNHESDKLRSLWFAIPKKLEENIDLIPERAGVLIVNETGNVTVHRRPRLNMTAQKLSDKEKFQLARLGAMRIWNLKWLRILSAEQNRQAKMNLEVCK